MKLLPILVVAVLLLGSVIIFPITPAEAAPTTYVSVINPATGDGNFLFNNTSPPAGGVFTVNITVTDVLNLAGWQVNLTWDPTLLKINVTADVFLPPDHIFNGLDPTGPAQNINNAEGWVMWARAIGPSAPQDHFDGSGRMMCVKFTVIKAPIEGETLSCNLVLDRVGNYPTSLVNPNAEDISFTEQNGYYEYKWPTPPPPPPTPPTLAVEPPMIINSSLLPPLTFEISITIFNVTDLYGYEFSLSYDPNILCCISLTIHDPLNETHYLPEFAVNNTAGLVWVKVTYYSPAVPITTNATETLVTLIFRVKGIGATPLDLHNTSLTDVYERPIIHEAEDGFFANIVRDLAVIDVVPALSVAYQGWIVKINVTIKNEGEITETLFDVNAYYDNNTIGTITVPSLAPDAEITITFDWNTKNATPCNNYTISAEVPPLPFELDLSDNYLSDGKVKIKLVGDVNTDRKVDVKDLVLLVKAFASYPGHPRWNPDADLNGDHKIDIKDLVLLIKNFGKTC
jgi:hypothetical protein